MDEKIVQTIIVAAIGLLSAIVDNVPLVAAGRMYDLLCMLPIIILAFSAYCAGTGGSALIDWSAAGVAQWVWIILISCGILKT